MTTFWFLLFGFVCFHAGQAWLIYKMLKHAQRVDKELFEKMRRN